eukprot:8871915-Pyramimonas_sp.AAC.1
MVLWSPRAFHFVFAKCLLANVRGAHYCHDVMNRKSPAADPGHVRVDTVRVVGSDCLSLYKLLVD